MVGRWGKNAPRTERRLGQASTQWTRVLHEAVEQTHAALD